MHYRPSHTRTGFQLWMDEQEFALPHGNTVLGREADSMIVLIDPLISRKHARIHCDGVRATLEDLESRNGTRINGVLTSGPHTLRDGDRIGMGSTELVVRMLDADAPLASNGHAGPAPSPSGCRHRIADPTCPHCKATQMGADDEGSGNAVTAQARWSLGMLIEMLGRAMLSERVVDADRLMREAAVLVQEQLRGGERPAPGEMDVLREVATWLGRVQINDDWIAWVTSVQGAAQSTEYPRAGP